jgi:hypothetical protein
MYTGITTHGSRNDQTGRIEIHFPAGPGEFTGTVIGNYNGIQGLRFVLIIILHRFPMDTDILYWKYMLRNRWFDQK